MICETQKNYTLTLFHFLGSDTSLNPSLNFVIYTPTRDQTPLRIYDIKGKLTLKNIYIFVSVSRSCKFF